MSQARYFLDTNIVIYSFEPGAKGDIAKGLMREALTTGIGLISYQVVQEFFNVAFRKFAQTMSTGEAEDYFRGVLRPLISVHSSESLIGSAMRLHSHHISREVARLPSTTRINNPSKLARYLFGDGG